MAGGALYDLGIYNIHFVTGIFGKPKKVRYFANITKGVDTSGTLVLDYGDFKAVCINAKDCKSESYGMVEVIKAICVSAVRRAAAVTIS